MVARYRGIAGDGAAFAAALGEPLPVCLWANPLRAGPEELAHLLDDEELSAEPVGWHAGAFRLPADARPGLSWLYRAGLMQIQEEAALISVRLLDPRPGDRILDLCAAPGNKTAQIAVALGNRGTVIANDPIIGRLAPLHAAIARLGLVNVTTTAQDGRTYPTAPGSFDRVLVDAPCSGEGTVRKGLGSHRPMSDGFRAWLTGLQQALLRRAVDLCRPGGRIVYSTCTFAPEENEAVVDAVLRECGDAVRVAAVPVDGLPVAPGLTGWRSARFSQALGGAIRLWPHRADTGGFFAVALERTGGIANVQEPPARPAARPEEPALLERFAAHYGLPEAAFADLDIVRVGHRLRVCAADHRPPARPPPVATGLLLTRDKAAQPKLSTQAALAFGRAARRNVVDLSRDEIERYLGRVELAVDAGRLLSCDGPGPVLVRHRGHTLGVATLRRHGGGWALESLFPRRWG